MHNRRMYDWSDLQHFLAVARHGSTLAAARAIRVSQSTVHRRLAELERRLGRKLFTRTPAGYRLTEFGRDMLPLAERVEKAALEFGEGKEMLERGGRGIIRLTCPEPVMTRIVQSGLLNRFHARHPEFKVEFVMSDKYLDLSKGDADVAFRSGDTDDDVLVGRKIAESIWAVYASKAYVERNGQPSSIEDLRRHQLIGLDPSMSGHRLSTWLEEAVPGATMAARVNSVLGLVSAARSGIGIAPLPLALGDAEPDLIRVIGPVPELTRSWRILAHPDVRRTARVSAFFDFVNDEIASLRPILTG